MPIHTNTIANELARKLGRVPTHNEMQAEAKRIIAEATKTEADKRALTKAEAKRRRKANKRLDNTLNDYLRGIEREAAKLIDTPALGGMGKRQRNEL